MTAGAPPLAAGQATNAVVPVLSGPMWTRAVSGPAAGAGAGTAFAERTAAVAAAGFREAAPAAPGEAIRTARQHSRMLRRGTRSPPIRATVTRPGGRTEGYRFRDAEDSGARALGAVPKARRPGHPGAAGTTRLGPLRRPRRADPGPGRGVHPPDP